MLSMKILSVLQAEMAKFSLPLSEHDRASSTELKKIMILCAAKNDEAFMGLVDYFAVRSKLCAYIDLFPQENEMQRGLRQVKLDVLNQVDSIIFAMQAPVQKAQLEKIRMLTQVLDETATAESHAVEYNQLITTVTQQSWGAGLDAIMSIVSLNSLLAPIANSLSSSDEFAECDQDISPFGFQLKTV